VQAVKRRIYKRRFAVALVLLSSSVGIAIVAACVETEFQEGRFACAFPNGACPPGLQCAADGRCRTGGTVPPLTEGGSDEGSFADVITSETGIPPCVESRWSLEVDARAPSSVATTDDGRVFAAGTIGGNAGWIAEFDRCDGGIIQEKSYGIMGSRTRFTALASVESTKELVVSGSATTEAGATNTPVHGRFKAADLAQVTLLAEGTGVSSEATLIAVGKDGAQWMSGPNGSSGGGFIARVDPPTCTLPLTSRPGAITIGSDGKLRVMREAMVGGAPLDVIAADCKNEGPGADPLGVGTGTVTPGGLVPVPNDRLAATGTAQAANGTSFWIAKQQDDPKKWTVVSFDPNPADPDLGRSIAFDGEALFIGVSQRAVGATGTPTLYRFDVMLTPMARQVWSASPFGPRLFDIRQIAVDKMGKDSIFVVATTGNSGAIARCTKAGQCP
jgi:hypothetical protein